MSRLKSTVIARACAAASTPNAAKKNRQGEIMVWGPNDNPLVSSTFGASRVSICSHFVLDADLSHRFSVEPAGLELRLVISK